MMAWVVEYRLEEDRGTSYGPLRFYAGSYEKAVRVAGDLRNDPTVQTDSVVVS